MNKNSNEAPLLPPAEKVEENRKKKKKEEPDDTTSYEGSDEYRSAERQSKRAARKNYKTFKKENWEFWLIFNICIILISIGFGVGTFFILKNHSSNLAADQIGRVASTINCSGLKLVMYFIIILHCVNTVVCLINLAQLEIKLCS